MYRSILLCALFGAAISTIAQPSTLPVQRSENGWYLSPRGTIRILVIYAEIDYDKNPKSDPQPDGSDKWHKGELPAWKDDLFDPFALAEPMAQVSRYYHDMSLGQFIVLGDYIDHVVTVHESEQSSLRDWSGIAWDAANKLGALHTAHNLSMADFDQWTDGGKPGLPKVNRPDDPHSYDHVMVIYRNSSGLTHGQGSTDAGSAGLLFGHPSDTQSRFGAMNGLPFQILKHEFNHLLLGGNNFHSGGGNAKQFSSYQMCLQGGWSLMGAANSSLLTASAWDRQRLGWIAPGSQYQVRAWRPDGTPCNGDLDPMQGDTGLFVIGDFITTGDAIRIRIPNIPGNEYQQWIWLENHRGHQINGCATDSYMWENYGDSCVTPFAPGIYAQMQIDKDDREGTSIYGGYADYLKPMPANGYYDMICDESKMDHTCPFDQSLTIFQINNGMQNPLTGFQEMELPVYDRNGDGEIWRSEAYLPYVRYVNGRYDAQVVFNGRPEHAFTPHGNSKIGMGTNPGTSNALTRVQGERPVRGRVDQANNRVTYLNPFSIELLNEMPDGRITLRIRAQDPLIDRDVRWASDSIVLPAAPDTEDPALVLAKSCTIKLDRGFTPRRNFDPDTVRGRVYFNSPTHFTVSEKARVVIQRKAVLRLEQGSVLHLLPGSTLELGPKARLRIGRDCTVVLHPGARILQQRKAKVKCSGGGRLLRME